MKAVGAEGKSDDEVRHDKGHVAGRFHNDCKFCRRARAQERVDQLLAEGKLVQGLPDDVASAVDDGRQGGRRLPALSSSEQAVAFEAAVADGTVVRAAVADGTVVRASCICTLWWLTPAGLGSTCCACGSPMRAVRAP
jgi:hypothetical protein